MSFSALPTPIDFTTATPVQLAVYNDALVRAFVERADATREGNVAIAALELAIEGDRQHDQSYFRLTAAGSAGSGNSLQSHAFDELNGKIYGLNDSGSTPVLTRYPFLIGTPGDTAADQFWAPDSRIGHQGLAVVYTDKFTGVGGAKEALLVLAGSAAGTVILMRPTYPTLTLVASWQVYNTDAGNITSTVTYKKPGVEAPYLYCALWTSTAPAVEQLLKFDFQAMLAAAAAGASLDFRGRQLATAPLSPRDTTYTFPYQGIAADDFTVILHQANTNYYLGKLLTTFDADTLIRRRGRLTRIGLNQAMTDETTGNENAEGEGVSFFTYPGASTPTLTIGQMSGSSSAKKRRIYFMGPGELGQAAVQNVLNLMTTAERWNIGHSASVSIGGVSPRWLWHGASDDRGTHGRVAWSTSANIFHGEIYGRSRSGQPGTMAAAGVTLQDGDNVRLTQYYADGGAGAWVFSGSDKLETDGAATSTYAPVRFVRTIARADATTFEGQRQGKDGKLILRSTATTSVAALNISTPTFATDAAAGTGGLVTGDVYKNASGNLAIKL